MNSINAEQLDELLTQHRYDLATIVESNKSGNSQQQHFILQMANKLLSIYNSYYLLKNKTFLEQNFTDISTEHSNFYTEITTDGYGNSYSNPNFSLECLGGNLGLYLSMFYAKIFTTRKDCFCNNLYGLERISRWFIKICAEWGDEEQVKDNIIACCQEINRNEIFNMIQRQFDPDYTQNIDYIFKTDFSNPAAMYRYGLYVSEDTMKLSMFLAQYPKHKLAKFAKQMLTCYLDGFRNEGKDISGKSTVFLAYYLGQEPIIKEIIKEANNYGLKVILAEPSNFTINPQHGFDHKFDIAAYYTEEYSYKQFTIYQQAYKQFANLLQQCSGRMGVQAFGKPTFIPKRCPNHFMFSREQNKIINKYKHLQKQTIEKYMPSSEISYTIVSFPTYCKKLESSFPEVFSAILDVNMLTSKKYELLQQILIDNLDLAKQVHIKGKNGNDTDITVCLHKLQSPETESNFLNCGANKNIPVGELFTTPMLQGTNGLLHVKYICLQNVTYQNLRLTFKDGFITGFSCSNYQTKEENEQYIKQNLLQGKTTLPMGEFAIGTNTLAYKVTQKFSLHDILPVLIAEKTGPHFAIGDPCFAWAENTKHYNPYNNKQMVAVENDLTAQRRENPHHAYSNCHIDITIPYDDIAYIRAICENLPPITIIQDGRFALAEVYELNKPLEE